MNNKALSIILVLVMILTLFSTISFSASAETNGMYDYEILGNGTAEITYYYGEDSDVVIPFEIDGYTVTSIGESAFAYKDNIERVEIPDTVISIGEKAFFDLFMLYSIEIPSSVVSIGDYAFGYLYASYDDEIFAQEFTIYGELNTEAQRYAKANGFEFKMIQDDFVIAVQEDNTAEILDYLGEETDLIIPAQIDGMSVTKITYLGNSDRIKSVSIPNGVTQIDFSFRELENLESITVDDDNSTFTSVLGALYNKDITSLLAVPCKKASLAIPDTVSIIGDQACFGCSLIESITIPDTVTEIGGSAFYACEKLNSITTSKNLVSIGGYVFFGCSSLENVALPDSLKTIGNSAFSRCSGLKTINIPKSVTSIGNGAFSGCSSLENIVIPKSVTVINYNTFNGCSKLKSIEIPDTVTEIGFWAFLNCDSLSSITVPSSVTMIGDNAIGYYENENLDYILKDNFTIYGYTNTEAERYANANDIAFVTIQENPVILGDADGDDIVTIIDATTIQRYLANLISEDRVDLIVADINGDGIDILDATFIQRWLADFSVDYPIGEEI